MEQMSEFVIATIEFLFAMAVLVFTIIVMWKVYQKAGEHGWAIFIPFYNTYVLFKMAEKKKLFWVYLLVSLLWIGLLFSFIFAYIFFSKNAMMSDYDKLGYTFGFIILASILYFVSAIGQKIILLFTYMSLANKFNKSKPFGIGLTFVPIVFFAILAFDNSAIYLPKYNQSQYVEADWTDYEYRP